MPIGRGHALEVVAEQGDVTVGQGRLRPAPDGAPDVGRGQGRGVVDPVADHDAPGGARLQGGQRVDLAGRAEPARASVDRPARRPPCRTAGALSPLRMARVQAHGRRWATGGAGLGPQRGGHGDGADHAGRPRSTTTTVSPRSETRRETGASEAGQTIEVGRRPTRDPVASTVPVDAHAGQ